MHRLTASFLWALSFQALSVATTDVATICQQVIEHMPNRISYMSSSAFNESISTYFSAQESELEPECIFSPEDASEVSQFVKLLSAHTEHSQNLSSPTQIAVRSGGHTPWSGAANVEGGITIDLRAMNAVSLSQDQTVASIGGGGIWSDIYPQLIPYNLTVMGGRVVSVGVGGFLTGGKRQIRLKLLLTKLSKVVSLS
jgi:FAD/FMN-containing dehydrogenase